MTRYVRTSIHVRDAIYFDANPLVNWAAGRAGCPDLRDQVAYRNIETLVGGDSSLYLSPLTLVEVNSTLYKLVRRNEGVHSDFSVADAADAEQQLMHWIADKRIEVPQLGQRAFEVGMSYVAAATRQHGRRVYAWDAIHLFQACRLARELQQTVVIATADSDFTTLVEVFPEFATLIEIRDYTVEAEN